MKGVISGVVMGAAMLAIVILVVGSKGNDSNSEQDFASATATTDGSQVIEIFAKGGYSPGLVNASAQTPTLLNVRTDATYDCSSALRIPSLNYSVYLPPSGNTQIEIPPQKPGTTLRGLCSMGMYNFAIKFN